MKQQQQRLRSNSSTRPRLDAASGGEPEGWEEGGGGSLDDVEATMTTMMT